MNKIQQKPISPEIQEPIVSGAIESLNVAHFPWIDLTPKQLADLVDALGNGLQPLSLRWSTGQTAILYSESEWADDGIADEDIVNAYLRSTLAGMVYVPGAGL
jgi:hypothetical protein